MAKKKWDGEPYEATIKIKVEAPLAELLFDRYGFKRPANEQLTLFLGRPETFAALLDELEAEIDDRDRHDQLAKLAGVPAEVLEAALKAARGEAK